MKHTKYKLLFTEAGFSLMEIMITAGLALILALAAATIQNYQAKGNKVTASQASNTALAAAVRSQLSRRESCVPSMVVKPANYTGQSEIAVQLGNTAGADRVQAGQELKSWKLRVNSLNVRNFSQYGTNSAGNTIYFGDVYLQADTAELEPGNRVKFKEASVVHLTFEVSGTTLVSCYAGDSYSDSTQQLEQVCNLVMSPDGVPGTWANGRCTVGDSNPAATCASLGGVWTGTACRFMPETFIIATGVPYGAPSQACLTCPGGSSITGGTCHSGSGPAEPLGGIFVGNTYCCGWPAYATTTQYNVYAVCAR